MDGDISGMLRQVMENPQFGAMVQAMKAQMGDGADGGIDPAKVMEKMPELMSVLGPAMGAFAQSEPKTEEKADKEEKTDIGDPDKDPDKKEVGEKDKGENPLGNIFFKPGNRDKRNKLLAALKPYLSPARCTLVDRAMSAMQLGELLGTVVPPKQDQ